MCGFSLCCSLSVGCVWGYALCVVVPVGFMCGFVLCFSYVSGYQSVVFLRANFLKFFSVFVWWNGNVALPLQPL